MNAFYYAEEFADRKYPSQSFEWIEHHAENIADISRDSGISAGAIAGIMAEERKDYLDAEMVNELSDLRARLRLTPTEQEVVNNMVAGPNEALLAYLSSLGNRPKMTHEDWVAELAEVEAKFPDPDAKPGILDKLQHPSLIDVGYGNFRIRTAVRLMNEYPDMASALELDIYKNDYAKLVEDLIEPTSEATARFYALYAMEAEQWFIDHNAYNGQWHSLPQELKDALLVTFMNLGEKQIAERMRSPDGMGYQPQPALTEGGGMNHLLNAQQIGQVIGLSGYGANSRSLSLPELAALAAQDTPDGLAARYALTWQRSVVLPALDYSGVNALGQLDLLHPDTGQGNWTQAMIEDRAAMLAHFAQAAREGVKEDATGVMTTRGLNTDYIDWVSGRRISLRLGNGTTDARACHQISLTGC